MKAERLQELKAKADHDIVDKQRGYYDLSRLPCEEFQALVTLTLALYDAAHLLEIAEERHANCTECNGDGVPELCLTCFPYFDAARLKRRAALDTMQAENRVIISIAYANGRKEVVPSVAEAEALLAGQFPGSLFYGDWENDPVHPLTQRRWVWSNEADAGGEDGANACAAMIREVL
jgi:hypothetical protein